jgi:hypothetical protein
MPVSFRRSFAQPTAIGHPSFPLPVSHWSDFCRPFAWLTAGRRLSLCGLGVSVLLGSVSGAGAQQATALTIGTASIADRLPGFVETASRRFRVPVPWIRAVMQVESGGLVNAVSPMGAMGLMQIMPDTWAELQGRYGLGTNPFDPYDNILAGTAYLRELLDRFGERGFLAAYNAGPGRYQEHLATGKPLPSETLAYVTAVTSLPAFPSSDGVRPAVSWSSSSLFAATASAGFTPSRTSPDKLPDTGSPGGPGRMAAAHVPHSDGLFARIADRGAPR